MVSKFLAVSNSKFVISLTKKIKTQLKKIRKFYREEPFYIKSGSIFLASIIVFSVVFPVFDSKENLDKYNISSLHGRVISKPVGLYAEKLTFDKESNKYIYNQGYTGGGEVAGQTYSPKIVAEFGADDNRIVTVRDPISEVGMSLTPKFRLQDPQKKDNFIIYPVVGMKASTVFTLKASGVKEDIVLFEKSKNSMEFSYDIGLDAGLEARLDSDGSIGVYGADSRLLGNVTTATEKDAEILQKARENSKKDRLIFSIPAPVVIESGKKSTQTVVKTWFSLNGKTVTVHADNLRSASYPLSIDPSVYVETAKKLMRGNNETNVDFDIDNELIQKSHTTGARIDSWSSTTNLTSAVWGQGTAVAGGFIYSVGGVGSATTSTTTYNTAGSNNFVVPAGVTNITVKAWGGGGAGGNGSGGSGRGGNGGGGGYAKSVISVTPGETLTVTVGSGGADSGTVSSGGGNGGGFSAVQRSGTYLIQAGGGGGGGGSRGNNNGDGGNGGAGGGATADNGVVGESGNGGGFGYGGSTTLTGTPSDGGTAGTGGTAGASGVANAGGNGAGSDAATCNDAMEAADTGGNGGFGGGGADGNDTSSCSNGGGGGGGRFGGGGGGSTTSNNAGGGGGGGGSSLVTGTSQVELDGNGSTPGNNTDPDRGGLADGGTGGTSTSGGTGGDNGIVLISYVNAGAVASAVYWAEFNTTTNAITSPNPGTGACSGWCTNSAYDLPTALTNLSLVAYNGFLYAIGGSNSGGTPQTTVYIAKLGANGEPQLWHPSGGTPVYWYSDTALSNARSQFGAVAYNNRLYILGGLTTSTTVLSTNTVQYANINPTGTLSTWTSTGMSALGTARYGLTAHVYNGVIYALGGNATFSGSPVSTVEYAKLNSDGTMNSWVATSSMISGGRLTVGGSFSTIIGGYVYITGGCLAVDSNGYCTSIASDVQLASINADGSLAEWNTILGLTNDRFAHTLIAWQGGMYRLGGCREQETSVGQCINTALDVDYGVINPDGEASTVATSSASGASTCTGGSPYNCDLPSASVGDMLNATVVINGYLYIMGGCTSDDCTTYSSGVTYQAIGSDGTLQRPASCSGSYTDSYCVSSTSLPSSRAAPGVAVFNNTIYLVGGFPTITNISRTTVNADGSIGAWSNTDFTDIAVNGIDDDLSYTFAYARANPATASSVPGNLFIFGGCTGTTSGIGCSSYSQSVYKCDISTAGAPSNCTITGQLQIGTVTGASGSGLGAHAGAVYANYIYLMGGLAPGITDLTEVRYARFDDSNNVVAVSGGAWIEGTNELITGRRRGTGFGYNGFLYVLGGYDGADAIADIEFAKINVSDGSWEVFDQSSVTIQKRWGLSSAVSNSYAYVVGGCIDGPAPSGCNIRTDTIQTFQIYNNDSGTLKSVTAFSDDTLGTDDNRWGASSAIRTEPTTNRTFLYVAGGCISATDCTDATSEVQFAEISKSDGSVGTWSNATNDLPSGVNGRAWGKLVNVGNTLYYIGGQEDTATNEQSTVYYLSSFTGAGDTNAAWSTASGALGDVSTAGVQTAPRTKFGVGVWNSRIYVVGGLDGSAAVSNAVYISPQLSSGGNIAADSWTLETNLPDVARYGGAVTAYANNLYLFGGNNGTQYLNDGQFTQINSDGSLDAWTFTTSLPTLLSEADAFAANGYMYVVGGRSAAASCQPQTLIAPISANTTIVTGNNPTGVGEWYETNTQYVGGRYGAAVSYEKGKMYINGGGCDRPQSSTYSTGTITQSGNTVTAGGGAVFSDNLVGGTITYLDASTARVVSYNAGGTITVSVSKTIGTAQTYSIATPIHSYAVLKSQPQVATYSRMIDTDTDVFPNSWLINGIDNSIGARWQASYRSMHDISDSPNVNPSEDCGTSSSMATMTTWGQQTDYGDVTMGDVATYTPLNSTGGNINCARYFYFFVTIDASKTFGYPEDVDRGPTINDISLFFTSDPSKRLRHGKTFTGGEQQPLDTPCRQSNDAQCPLP